jgi:hypothetical protein
MTEGFVFMALAASVAALVIYGLLPSRKKQAPMPEPEISPEPPSKPIPPPPSVEPAAAPQMPNPPPLIPGPPETRPVVRIPVAKPPPAPLPSVATARQPEKAKREDGLPAFDGLCVACRAQPMDPANTTFLCANCVSLPEFSSFGTETDQPVPSLEGEVNTLREELHLASMPQGAEQPHEEDLPEIQVTSSVIRAVLYYPKHKVLRIRLMDGSVYRYFMVPQDVFDRLMQAESKGSYYQSHIAGVFHNKRDSAPTPPQTITPPLPKAPSSKPKTSEIPVTSSNISTVLYHEGHQLLQIRFRDGSLYWYFKVPGRVFENLMNAESKGRYAHDHIYSWYTQSRMGTDEVALFWVMDVDFQKAFLNPQPTAETTTTRPGYCQNHPNVRAMPDGSGLCYECNR